MRSELDETTITLKATVDEELGSTLSTVIVHTLAYLKRQIPAYVSTRLARRSPTIAIELIHVFPQNV